MPRRTRTAWLVAASMLCAAALAYGAKPSKKISDRLPPIVLEEIVPKTIGPWSVDPSVAPVVVDPQTQAKLNAIYNQTLARTYTNSVGQRIMLSIAYGGDQSDAMQVHRPEVCYTAQGFQVLRQSIGQLGTAFGTLPVKRLFAVQGARSEPITYWVVVGDTAIHAGFRQKLQQIKYGLTGTIPDGMLVRVSSIGNDEKAAYEIQDAFLKDLLNAIPDSSRVRVAGKFASAN